MRAVCGCTHELPHYAQGEGPSGELSTGRLVVPAFTRGVLVIVAHIVSIFVVSGMTENVCSTSFHTRRDGDERGTLSRVTRKGLAPPHGDRATALRQTPAT